MEAHLRYQRELNSGSIKNSLGAKKATIPKKAVKKRENPPEPEIDEKLEIKPEPRLDFIQRNIYQASQQAQRTKVPKPEPKEYGKVHRPGEVPRYIEERKANIILENAPPPDVKCPRGMRIMTEEEKHESRRSLNERKAEIEAQLARAPLRIESPQLLRSKRMLEQEIADLEQSLNQLSKKYVFVPE